MGEANYKSGIQLKLSDLDIYLGSEARPPTPYPMVSPLLNCFLMSSSLLVVGFKTRYVQYILKQIVSLAHVN